MYLPGAALADDDEEMDSRRWAVEHGNRIGKYKANLSRSLASAGDREKSRSPMLAKLNEMNAPRRFTANLTPSPWQCDLGDRSWPTARRAGLFALAAGDGRVHHKA
jgi:hypothetical protein